MLLNSPMKFNHILSFWAFTALISLICSCREQHESGLASYAVNANVRVGVAAAPGDERREQIVIREFNAISSEGEFLWQVIHPAPDTWDFTGADKFIDFAEQHNLYTTLTHFVWDQKDEWSQVPQWVHDINDPDELKSVMRQHIRTITQRYGNKLKRWITVNEPFDYYNSTALYKNHFYKVLGESYIEDVFRIASEEAPESELWLNEIFTETNPTRSEALVQLATDLVSDGVPIDGVGLQGHLFSGDPDTELVENTMRQLGALGLKVAITELDAPVGIGLPDRLTIQAKRMASMVRVCLAVPECDSITWWGVDDGVSWIDWILGPGLSPLLFDEHLRPKPAYFSVRDELKNGRP